MKAIHQNFYNAYPRKRVQGYKKTHSFSVTVLDPECFDGLELFLVYKLQYKEAAPEGNGVYFCSK